MQIFATYGRIYIKISPFERSDRFYTLINCSRCILLRQIKEGIQVVSYNNILLHYRFVSNERAIAPTYG